MANATRAVQKRFNRGYVASLHNGASRRRYDEKLNLLSSTDPYEETQWEEDIDTWPAVMYAHACVYLILYPSPLTRDEMLNYKSLECFKNFQCGWVREVFVKDKNNKSVVIGTVSYSFFMVCLRV